ncbi:hypothetical protein [Chenggangzhangella methanolivorans]|uniref:Uncharacterized protein n=1 Tax=Chenggangzhangella methanolivorans TaxID=1437009 RepID=A0A9E6UL13_9HYPH|nr:hypothetical protein [Chenggangzhangella methanolivorans]QZN98470.1 hypothetical protein K6K41_15500 [Chenggangzhangella methanolivorans]
MPEVGVGGVGAGGSGGAEGAIAKMEEAFNRAISLSAEVTEKTTELKAQLDAAKQRPQN